MKAAPATPAIAACERAATACARRLASAVWWTFAAGLAIALAAGSAAAASARIQYLSSANVYLDAGRDAGLAEGMSVRVERQGQVVAELVVDFVAQTSASCTIRSSTAPLRAGDLCTFTPSATLAVPAPGGPTTAAPGRSTMGLWSRVGSVRGSVSTLYTQATDPGGTYSNPALRADLRWRGDGREELALRVRADRPVWDALASAAGTRPHDVHVYEGSLRYSDAGERIALEGGRLVPQHLELLGSIDGGSAIVRPVHAVRVGVAAGRGSNVRMHGLVPRGRRYGGFVEASARSTQGLRRWRSVVAAARIDDLDVTRRQFVQWRTDAVVANRVRVFDNLEVDVNPGWKRARGEPHVEIANWTLTTQVDLHHRLDLSVGFDTSRDPLLPEHRALATAFVRKESHGVRAATRIGLAKRTSLRLACDLRDRSDDELRQGWDASLVTTSAGTRHVTFILHGSLYDTRFGTGQLANGAVALQATQWMRVDVGGGTTRHDDPLASGVVGVGQASGWVRTGVDIEAGSGLWVGASAEWRSRSAGRELTLELGRHF